MGRRRRKCVKLLLGLAVLVWVVGCTSPSVERRQAEEAEAISLLGEKLYRIALSAEEQERLEENLRVAQANYEADQRDPENWIWLGRRLAYLWRYKDSVAVFSDALARFPEEPRLYRHRGHRYITLRQFDLAIADLTRAAELVRDKPDRVEPDGAPNPRNIPRSTLKSNIWYHLGLAHYLKGDFDEARMAYEECLKVSRNDDMLVATIDWLYMTYRRLGHVSLANQIVEPVGPVMDIMENDSYHRRILMYKGLLKPEEILDPTNASDLDLATQGYGVGNWLLYNGHNIRAREVFRQVLEGSYWSAFGYIASEAELSRLGELDDSSGE